jgi:uncharacterized coiled-coil protein SlyX
MPSLLQKSDQSQLPLVPAWHPDFRNPARLPDTKVVRTQFFVNFATIAIAASLLLYFSYQEYRINNLSRQVAYWQTQIDTNKKASMQARMLSQKFAAEEKKINELNNFVKPRLVLSQFLLNLGSTLPQELAVITADIRNTGVNLRGIANGSPDEASGRTSTYVEQLRQDKYFSSIFEEVGLNKLDRDQASGRLSFDLFLRFKGAVVKK